MATIKSVNIDRIRWCMSDRNINAEELAAEIGVKEEKLNAIFDGEAAPSLTLLKKIAKYFNRGLLFFLSEGQVNETELRTAGFRTLANMHPQLDPDIKALMERVERQRRIFIGLREDIDDDSRMFDPPEVPSDDPRKAAEIIRKWLPLNGDKSFDGYRRALEARDILVFRSNGYRGEWQVPKESEVEGFAIFHTHFPIIFVKKHDTKKRELFTLAHELGHLILHRDGSLDNLDTFYSAQGKESAVNAFAGHLLVSDSVLRGISDSEKPGTIDEFESWLSDPANACGVSTEVILRRLLDAGRLSRKEYEEYREWKLANLPPPSDGGRRLYRHREPVHVFGRPFVGAVLEALGAKQITITRASRFLDNLKIEKIHRLQKEFNAF